MTNPATPRQIDFINTLIAEREVPEALAAAIKAISVPNTKEASVTIGTLLGLPRKTNRPSPVDLSTIPKSRYAIPVEDIEVGLTKTDLRGNTHLFLEVKEYKGTLYFRRLVGGGLGDFARERVALADQPFLVKTIERDSLKYAQNFGELFTCCGKCGKSLTDALSRELKIGPECRKTWGI